MKYTFGEYQQSASETAVYPDRGENFIYPTLGLAGEAGEVCEKVKKIIRDRGGVPDTNDRDLIFKELGDVLWYVSTLCDEFGFFMEDVATFNLKKLSSRKNRDQLKGSGDNR